MHYFASNVQAKSEMIFVAVLIAAVCISAAHGADSALEVSSLSQLYKLMESNNQKLLDEIRGRENSYKCGSKGKGFTGSTFVLWGNSSCPDETFQMYTGYVGGGHYTGKGGPANLLCLPDDPIYGEYSSAKGSAGIWGTEYHTTDTKPNYARVLTHDVPCSVCQLKRRDHVVMIPARNACYPGWKNVYDGYLMGGHWGHAASEYICVDKNPGSVTGGQERKDGQVIYLVEGNCGSLPCPPYKQLAELTCVVCAK